MNPATNDVVSLRRSLHAHPEPADHEEKTARTLLEFLKARTEPTEVVTGLGGHGLALTYGYADPGPTVLLRADLDALPIFETLQIEHVSRVPGVAHKCGHDGHMAILVDAALRLWANKPTRGRLVVLFQPAEETGMGAERLIEDPKFDPLRPDYAFALHNLPGFERGCAVLRRGGFASASTGMVVELEGATSHAAEPEKGRSPALAVASLIQGFSAAPQLFTALHEAAKATVIHARLGERAFGTSPGYAAVMCTLRAYRDEVMETMKRRCVHLVESVAQAHELRSGIDWVEEFPATVNDDDCVELIEETACSLSIETIEAEVPFPWSEDFGHFTRRFKGAMFGLGSGVDHPALHHPDYDFPDDIIPVGGKIFEELVRRALGSDSG